MQHSQYFLQQILGVDIKILWCIYNCLIDHDQILVVKLVCIWWRVNNGQSTNEIKLHVKFLSYHDSHINDMCPSHMAALNEEGHVAMLEEKTHMKNYN